MARSSITRTANTVGVSRLPTRPKSVSTLEMTPEEETHVTPAMTRAPMGPHPMMSAKAAPGTAFSRASHTPTGAEDLSVPTSSRGENSSPSIKSSSTTPTSEPVFRNGMLASNDKKPPTPKSSPMVM